MSKPTRLVYACPKWRRLRGPQPHTRAEVSLLLSKETADALVDALRKTPCGECGRMLEERR